MKMNKIVCLVLAVLGLVGEVFACCTYASDVANYNPYKGTGYLYELPFTSHETVMTLIAIVSGLALIAGVVLFFGNDKESAKA